LAGAAAIDVGSNAMRIAIGVADDSGSVEIVENLREPVRLGRDAFTHGVIGDENQQRTLEAFRRFRELIDEYQPQHIRAVATSAMREAKNRDVIIDRIKRETGIHLETIGGAEEARLVFWAARRPLELDDKRALLIDIGGGSVEVSRAESGALVDSESFKLGTVRLLELLQEEHGDQTRFIRLVEEYADSVRRRVRRKIGETGVDLCIGTGGNVEALGDLRGQLLGKNNLRHVKLTELQTIIEKLGAHSYLERVEQLGLRPDRADVIVPAAIVMRNIVAESGVKDLQVPRVGLKEGILQELLEASPQAGAERARAQVLASARALGAKYDYDREHGEIVAQLAVRLFDDLQPLHGLGGEERLILEVAAMVHDIGQYVRLSGHHKHSLYLIRSAPFIGLSERQQELVANVARYHRKAKPKPAHEHFRQLSGGERAIVTKLAALLRVANALDVEHGGRVQDVCARVEDDAVSVSVLGAGDLDLEAWAVMRQADFFRHSSGLPLVLRRQPRERTEMAG